MYHSHRGPQSHYSRYSINCVIPIEDHNLITVGTPSTVSFPQRTTISLQQVLHQLYHSRRGPRSHYSRYSINCVIPIEDHNLITVGTPSTVSFPQRTTISLQQVLHQLCHSHRGTQSHYSRYSINCIIPIEDHNLITVGTPSTVSFPQRTTISLQQVLHQMCHSHRGPRSHYSRYSINCIIPIEDHNIITVGTPSTVSFPQRTTISLQQVHHQLCHSHRGPQYHYSRYSINCVIPIEDHNLITVGTPSTVSFPQRTTISLHQVLHQLCHSHRGPQSHYSRYSIDCVIPVEDHNLITVGSPSTVSFPQRTTISLQQVLHRLCHSHRGPQSHYSRFSINCVIPIEDHNLITVGTPSTVSFPQRTTISLQQVLHQLCHSHRGPQSHYSRYSINCVIPIEDHNLITVGTPSTVSFPQRYSINCVTQRTTISLQQVLHQLCHSHRGPQSHYSRYSINCIIPIEDHNLITVGTPSTVSFPQRTTISLQQVLHQLYHSHRGPQSHYSRYSINCVIPIEDHNLITVGTPSTVSFPQRTTISLQQVLHQLCHSHRGPQSHYSRYSINCVIPIEDHNLITVGTPSTVSFPQRTTISLQQVLHQLCHSHRGPQSHYSRYSINCVIPIEDHNLITVGTPSTVSFPQRTTIALQQVLHQLYHSHRGPQSHYSRYSINCVIPHRGPQSHYSRYSTTPIEDHDLITVGTPSFPQRTTISLQQVLHQLCHSHRGPQSHYSRYSINCVIPIEDHNLITVGTPSTVSFPQRTTISLQQVLHQLCHSHRGPRSHYSRYSINCVIPIEDHNLITVGTPSTVSFPQRTTISLQQVLHQLYHSHRGPRSHYSRYSINCVIPIEDHNLITVGTPSTVSFPQRTTISLQQVLHQLCHSHRGPQSHYSRYSINCIIPIEDHNLITVGTPSTVSFPQRTTISLQQVLHQLCHSHRGPRSHYSRYSINCIIPIEDHNLITVGTPSTVSFPQRTTISLQQVLHQLYHSHRGPQSHYSRYSINCIIPIEDHNLITVGTPSTVSFPQRTTITLHQVLHQLCHSHRGSQSHYSRYSINCVIPVEDHNIITVGTPSTVSFPQRTTISLQQVLHQLYHSHIGPQSHYSRCSINCVIPIEDHNLITVGTPSTVSFPYRTTISLQQVLHQLCHSHSGPQSHYSRYSINCIIPVEDHNLITVGTPSTVSFPQRTTISLQQVHHRLYHSHRGPQSHYSRFSINCVIPIEDHNIITVGTPSTVSFPQRTTISLQQVLHQLCHAHRGPQSHYSRYSIDCVIPIEDHNLITVGSPSTVSFPQRTTISLQQVLHQLCHSHRGPQSHYSMYSINCVIPIEDHNLITVGTPSTVSFPQRTTISLQQVLHQLCHSHRGPQSHYSRYSINCVIHRGPQSHRGFPQSHYSRYSINCVIPIEDHNLITVGSPSTVSFPQRTTISLQQILHQLCHSHRGPQSHYSRYSINCVIPIEDHNLITVGTPSTVSFPQRTTISLQQVLHQLYHSHRGPQSHYSRYFHQLCHSHRGPQSHYSRYSINCVIPIEDHNLITVGTPSTVSFPQRTTISLQQVLHQLCHSHRGPQSHYSRYSINCVIPIEDHNLITVGTPSTVSIPIEDHNFYLVSCTVGTPSTVSFPQRTTISLQQVLHQLCHSHRGPQSHYSRYSINCVIPTQRTTISFPFVRGRYSIKFWSFSILYQDSALYSHYIQVRFSILYYY